MGKLFDNPAILLVLIVVVILLFAAPKLPAMARSLGQSMRIIKSEVKEMKNDGKTENTSAAPEPPVEGRIVNNPQQQGTQAPGPQQQQGSQHTGDGNTPSSGL
ncbi:MAG: Sec-independent protein translocase subunit TatA [Actinomycetales bacterium]